MSISQGTKISIFAWDVTGKLKELSRGQTSSSSDIDPSMKQFFKNSTISVKNE